MSNAAALTRTEALEIAKARHAAHKTASLAKFFAGQVSDADYNATDATFGRSQGWYIVDGHGFSEHEITGIPYDMHQSGWAWV